MGFCNSPAILMTYLLGRSQSSSQLTLEGSVLPCFGCSPSNVLDLDHDRSIPGTDLRILIATFCSLCELSFWFRWHNLYEHKLKVIPQLGFILSSWITAVQIKLHAKKHFNLKKKKKTPNVLGLGHHAWLKRKQQKYLFKDYITEVTPSAEAVSWL